LILRGFYSWVTAYRESGRNDRTSFLTNVFYTSSPEKKTSFNVTGDLSLYLNGDTNLVMNSGGGIAHQYRKNFSIDAGARFHIVFTEETAPPTCRSAQEERTTLA
jgi:uncharacterized protein YozE (UPF0346 family)